MIVDSSALLAVILGEPERERFLDALGGATGLAVSAASYVACAAVLDRRRDPVLSRQLDELLSALAIEMAGVTASQAYQARSAYRDFGRGSEHPANLNFGDCFSYALAKDRDEPLLFKGDDFGHTDVRVALAL